MNKIKISVFSVLSEGFCLGAKNIVSIFIATLL